MNEEKIIERRSSKATITIPFLGGVVFVILLIVYLNSSPVNHILMIPMILAVISSLLLYFQIGLCSIVVTNQRVYGKSSFGRRVELPLDLISAVGKTSLFNGIAISTSSGRIKFYMIQNSSEVFNEVSSLLRQRNNKSTSTVQQVTSQSNADELKKYKDLLENGVITQDEFDAKKKQLLGL